MVNGQFGFFLFCSYVRVNSAIGQLAARTCYMRNCFFFFRVDLRYLFSNNGMLQQINNRTQ